jgi:hypothetical protein
MSYSFVVNGATKDEAKQKIVEAFDGVVAQQPIHKVDRDSVVACAQAFVDALVGHSDGQEIVVGISGSVSWQGQDEFIGVGANISASLRSK